MNFLNKDYTVHLIDLLKLILISLGAGAGIHIYSDAAGWIMFIAAFFVCAWTILEVYQHYNLERKKK